MIKFREYYNVQNHCTIDLIWAGYMGSNAKNLYLWAGNDYYDSVLLTNESLQNAIDETRSFLDELIKLRDKIKEQ